MNKGFPRPRIENKGKVYPLPYTAEEKSIAVLHDDRFKECLIGRLCIVCGEGVNSDACFAILKSGVVFGESGPFHEKCAKMTLFLCPHMKDDPIYQMMKFDMDDLYEGVMKFWKDTNVEI